MRLAELRNNKKISQKELATQIGYSQNMISQWENGTRDPGTEVLKKLAAFLMCLLIIFWVKITHPKIKKSPRT